MFGATAGDAQNEKTPFNPVNPYAAAKVYAHQMARIYRDSYGLHIACGILFNHESERRPAHFLTQKVAHGAACAALGVLDSPDRNEMGRPIVEGGKLALGNLAVARDWGYAGDFVRAMWLMLKQDNATDYVIGTEQLHTIQQLCDTAYSCVDRDWRKSVVSDPALMRPAETGQTLADASKAHSKLGWYPTVQFNEMVERMVAAQILRLGRLLGGSK
jgi:GDPmannose 4,6-dehydratase